VRNNVDEYITEVARKLEEETRYSEENNKGRQELEGALLKEKN
jgi:hypothetical protein